MSTGFWNNGRHTESTLAAQISALQGELRALRKEARKRGSESYDDARETTAELIEALREGIAAGGHDMARQARRAGGMVREHPGTAATAAAVGLVVVGLVATMLFSRSSR